MAIPDRRVDPKINNVILASPDIDVDVFASQFIEMEPDMIGNVCEWTSDFRSTQHPEPAAKYCCIPKNPRGGALEASDPRQPAIRIARRVL